jgi:phenylacetate-CoA ligase
MVHDMLQSRQLVPSALHGGADMSLNWRKLLVFGVLRATGSPIPDELRLLRSIERKSSDEVRELQRRRLAMLLRHAWENTEYYRDILSESGVVRDGKVDLDQFENIPFLTKDIIRRQGERLRARTLPQGRKPYANRTGGSTGEPVAYWQDSYYWDINVATKLYHFEVLGKEVGELEMKIWGSDRDFVTETSSWKPKLKNFLYNRKILKCSRLAEGDIHSIVNDINRFRPKSLWGYIDGLYTIAAYVNRHGLEVHPPAAVFGGGGTLFPHMEQAVQTAFQAPAINFYGSREMGDVACECREKGGLHVSSHSHYVEVVDRHGKPVLEEDGDIVLTSLHNYAMPFIRYRIGDRGRLTARTCACGRCFPLLETVMGRSMESFITPEGAVVSPIYLITMIGASLRPGFVKKLQLVQEDYRHVLLKVMLESGVSQTEIRAHLDPISEKIRSVMGEHCAVSYAFVDDIPPTHSGKYLYTVCKLPTHGYSAHESRWT